ncbi:MAG: hypothetical protein QM723_34285 [Myxococcaceae bacterium]
MSMNHGDQENSDPLPYTQVDRAVKQTAGLIASRLGVSFQHAIGGLVQFWELCGDPRDLEALLSAGKNEVVLKSDEVARRFAVAMAVDTGKLQPDDLAALRLLERKDDGYRVRGMSRYFKPLRRRAQARAAAAVGGKMSVKSRSERYGTSQPASAFASPVASGVASGHASELLRGNSEEPRSDSEANVEAPPNTADSGQRSSRKRVRAPGLEASRKRSAQEDFFAWAQLQASNADPRRAPEAQPKPSVLNATLKPALEAIGRSGLELAWRKFLTEPGARSQGWPWRFFVSQWQQHHNAALAANPQATEDRCQPL